jgi:hypothetical protein
VFFRRRLDFSGSGGRQGRHRFKNYAAAESVEQEYRTEHKGADCPSSRKKEGKVAYQHEVKLNQRYGDGGSRSGAREAQSKLATREAKEGTTHEKVLDWSFTASYGGGDVRRSNV